MNTHALLTAYKAHLNIKSDRQLARHLGIGHGIIHQAMTNRQTISHERALTIASELKLDKREVLIMNLIERENICIDAKIILLDMLNTIIKKGS